MFIKGASPIALLHAAASECSLQYASLITEIASDQTVLCGVELELPQQELMAPRREFFSGTCSFRSLRIICQSMCKSSVISAKKNFNLKITNYYCNGIIIYRELNIEHQPHFIARNLPLKVNDLPQVTPESHHGQRHN